MNIEMHRGDQFPISFNIVDDDGEPVTEINEITITCRKEPNTKSEILFQKKLSEETVTLENNEATFKILQSDTSSLEYGNYGYDIEIKTEEEIFTKTGLIKIIDEYTIGA